LSITSDLSFIGNNATNLRSIRFAPGSTLSGGSDVGCVYVSGADLYYTDTSNNVVRITQGGSVTGATGSITNLVSPASAVYSSGSETITFQSNTNAAANLDAGSITIRDTATNAKGITLKSPLSLAADYSVTLPGALPVSTSFVALDSSGNVSATIPVAGGLTTSNLSASAGIVGTQLANRTITSVNIGNGEVTYNEIGSNTIIGGNISNNVDLPGSNPSVNGGFIIVSGNANNPHNLAITTGNITTSSTVGRGVGWSVASASAITSTVTFSTAFIDVPVITATFEGVVFGASTFVGITAASTSAFTIIHSNGAGTGKIGVNFTAIGRRS
jgi:hypothetical protein